MALELLGRFSSYGASVVMACLHAHDADVCLASVRVIGLLNVLHPLVIVLRLCLDMCADMCLGM